MIGKILDNRYEIVEKIGSGGMATVYKAKCNLLNRCVAIKILKDNFADDEEIVKNFNSESQAAASLSNTNIVSIYDVGEVDNTYYIVMEYIEGVTLKEFIAKKGQLTERQVLSISLQIAKALSSAHKNNIIHRDIKPHNILVFNNESGDIIAKVTDFGIALASSSSTMTNTGNIVGSVHYFSPEQGRGGFVTESSDLYSLGIVMYEMITGRLPFEGGTPISIALKHAQQEPDSPLVYNDNISEDLEYIILKLLKKEQSKRYKSANELIEELENSINDSNSIIKNDNEFINGETIINDQELNKKIKRRASSSVNDDPEEFREDSPKKRVIMIISGILIGLILAVSVSAGGYYAFKKITSDKPVDIELMDMQGMDIEDAILYLEENNLRHDIIEIQDDEFEENLVIRHIPAPERVIREQSIVRIYVSTGPREIEVPDFTRNYESSINNLLNIHDLELGEIEYIYSDYPEGLVIDQSIEKGELVSVGQEIDFTVSKGREKETIIMVNLVGMQEEEAKRVINDLGLRVSNTSRVESEDSLEGEVLKQSIDSGREIEVGSSLNLVISLGYEEEDNTEEQEEEENNEDDDIDIEEEDEEDEEIEEALIKRILSIDVSNIDYSVNISVINNETEELVYNRFHDVEEKEILEIPIENNENIGDVSYRVLIDGEILQESIILNF